MNEIYITAGGDERFAAAAEHLAEKGYEVYSVMNSGSTAKAIKCSLADAPAADCLILPVPVTADGIHLFAPASADPVPAEVLTRLVKADGAVFGGRIPPDIKELFLANGNSVTDYTENEEFAVRNAAATAEGAVMAAMQAQDITLSGQRILITGFGRIGKALARVLSGFGAEVTVSARRREQLAWAEIYGCRASDISALADDAGRCTLIFNTVPAPVFCRDILEKTHRDALIIDLASAPGGIDLPAAKSLGLNVMPYRGVPGKTSPRTAGIITADLIENEMRLRRKGG